MKVFISVCFALCFSRFTTALKEVDLFREVSGLSDKNIKVAGVSLTTGHHSSSPALAFTANTKDLIASTQALTDVLKLIGSHDFVVTAYTKILNKQSLQSYTIVAISSKDGQQMYCVLSIKKTWTNKLEITFSIRASGALRTEKAITRNNVDISAWHKVEVRVQDKENLARLFLDDQLVYVSYFKYTVDPIPTANVQLRLAQVYQLGNEGEPEIVNRFIGDLQDVQFYAGSTADCSQADKPCECPVPGGNQCVMDGIVHKEGDNWARDNCTHCRCKNNFITCAYTCAVCTEANNTYFHGDTWRKDNCRSCKCENGKITCTRPNCPTLTCTVIGLSGRTIRLPGQCCSVCIENQCKGTDKSYKKCGCQKTCSKASKKDPCSGGCTEGCFCPEGSLLDNGKCVSVSQCGCTYNGIKYKPGAVKNDKCSMCMCIAGNMNCIKFCRK